MGSSDGEDRVGIIIAGGGTGGHIYPAIAIARELQSRVGGCDVLMVGTSRGLEAGIMPREGLPLATIAVAGLKGRGIGKATASMARLPAALAASWRLIGAHRPRVVIGVGGYASGPVVAAAVLRRRPTLIHEQNLIPGATNRWLAPFVREVAVTFPETRKRLRGRGVVTGNPVRCEFEKVAPLKLDRPGRRLLIFGGSQGAAAINRAMAAAAPDLASFPEKIHVLHQTGKEWVEELRTAYLDAGVEADVRPYIHDMAAAMEDADLILARAGATTVAELTACGRGSILVPFPQAIHDHQTLNAKALEKAGAAVVVPQSDLAGTGLAVLLKELLGSRDRLQSMASSAKSLGRPGAASEIAGLAMGLMDPPLDEACP
jgi:UDP-N-acetylglucosamine--N-acetylmuramyl-(pentapeptide) pyrophosphoryl-undecaprenol N-acetylglucosamine transferase